MSAFIDIEGVRENLQSFADKMEDLGFPGIGEELYGHGPVYRAVKHLSGQDEMAVIEKYLRIVAEKLKERRAQNPSDMHVIEAMDALRVTWENLKACIEMPRSEAEKKAAAGPVVPGAINVFPMTSPPARALPPGTMVVIPPGAPGQLRALPPMRRR